MKLLLEVVKTDGGTQPRGELNLEVIDEYAEAMKQGDIFPPITVFHDGVSHWLADGFHRYWGAEKAKLKNIEADIKKGTNRDAILYSVGANQGHGLRRSNADKRKSVRTLLNDPEWVKWADREVARRCGVVHTFVGTLRKESSGHNGQIEKTVSRGGTEYQMIIKREPYEELRMEQNISHRGEIKEIKGKDPTPIFNRTTDSIEWAKWTWNPVTGCNYGCAYCYAKDIGKRFTGHFKPTFHPERLTAPKNTKVPEDGPGERNVFVCSMADLFGDWVPQEWIDAVLKSVRESPDWTFLFLTKNPSRMVDIKWPKNAWVGTTVDTQARVKPAEDAFKKIKAEVKFVSLEPLKEKIKFSHPGYFNWFIIGGQSASSGEPAFQPEWHWVESLVEQARSVDAMVYFKPNLETRPKEYPR